MLEKYKEDYEEFYTIINNAIKNDKISHAYMLEIDDNLDQQLFERDLCKALILQKSDNKEIANLIDSNCYSNIRRINADGLWIKKEQILEIQNDFRKESVDGRLKIYIIEDASKLNKASANTLLKFLEEPEENIVAILMTKNRYSVINTIVSRCLNISLRKNEKKEIDVNDISYRIVELIEKYGKESLPYLYQTLLNKDYEKNEYFTIFENVQKIYSDLFHLNNNLEEKYNYFSNDLFYEMNYIKDNGIIIKKIEEINKNIEYLKFNVNIKTILDKIIIGIYGGD